MPDGGIVVKTGDGATYFIRDEILEACKVSDEELEVTEAMVEESSDVSGFSLNFAQPVQLGQASVASKFNVQANPRLPGGFDRSMSTIMCCW